MSAPTHPYIEREDGWFSSRYILRAPDGEALECYDSERAAEDALRDLLRPREGGGLLSWLF